MFSFAFWHLLFPTLRYNLAVWLPPISPQRLPLHGNITFRWQQPVILSTTPVNPDSLASNFASKRHEPHEPKCGFQYLQNKSIIVSCFLGPWCWASNDEWWHLAWLARMDSPWTTSSSRIAFWARSICPCPAVPLLRLPHSFLCPENFPKTQTPLDTGITSHSLSSWRHPSESISSRSHGSDTHIGSAIASLTHRLGMGPQAES